MSCSFCRGAEYTSVPFEVKTQRNNIVNVTFNYCPYCGRDIRTKELILCRDCKHSRVVIEKNNIIGYRCEFINGIHRGDFFCGLGYKKGILT